VILHRRAPRAWLVGVDTDAIQVAWRGLGDGDLMIRVLDDDVTASTELVLAEHGAAGAAHLTGLPSGRLLRIEVAGRALHDGPRVLSARTLTPPPGSELCRIATVSDLHLGTEVFGHRGTITDPVDHPDPHPVRCAEAAWDEAVGWGAERIIAKGDLTNVGRPEEWRAYARLVARSPVPVDAIPGNHDHARPGTRGALLPAEAAANWGLSIAQPLLVRDLPGLRVLLADTTLPGRNPGTLAPVANDLLDAAADADPTAGVLVVLHHHLQPQWVPEAWPPGISQRESATFLDRLGAAHPHAMVTSGHTHRNRRWGRAGVVVTQVGSTKDYPGAWAGYVVHEGGIRQVVRRIERPDCIAWTDHSRLAAFGAWEHASPGLLDARCFSLPWRQAP
jgi:3',5'-cyclic-AMP phosphodiesterase